MASGVDMSDKNAWDDSELMDTWNDALLEYKKYHSIHKSGKRLEDALTEAELRELREDYGDLMEEADPTSTAEINGDAGTADAAYSQQDGNVGSQPDQSQIQLQDTKLSEQQQRDQAVTAETRPPHEEARAASMPQAILGTVQDQSLKNIMMSWYYAGYYTGLHDGQQQASKDAQPPQ
ncbi:hypothetical protein IQ07DRAFT_645563 [Pyrenochaeta sp. DS3sAY3a]|nr:hypothetical protein IQ07DRAFT_645563 [Pyrenochaeta sp. DS3sAY3a]